MRWPRARENIDAALRIAEKHQLPLAIENHKDFTADEMAALMKEKESRWLGVCLDTGNNISLLDDPMALVEILAPYAITTHIKDMAVAPYPDGFLLSEMPLGEGMLDMRQIVDTIRPPARYPPDARNDYARSSEGALPDGRILGDFSGPQRRYLARTLRLVRDRRPRPLPC